MSRSKKVQVLIILLLCLVAGFSSYAGSLTDRSVTSKAETGTDGSKAEESATVLPESLLHRSIPLLPSAGFGGFFQSAFSYFVESQGSELKTIAFAGADLSTWKGLIGLVFAKAEPATCLNAQEKPEES